MAVTLDMIAERPRALDEQGRVTRLSRFVDVSGLTAGPNTLPSALEASGVPEDGDVHPNNADLYVARRIPRLTKNRTRVRIEVIYEFREQVEEEQIISVAQRMIQGGSSLRNIRTQFDGQGRQIVLKDTEGKEQAGFVDILMPQENLIVQFDEAHEFPPEVARDWTNTTNFPSWLDDPPSTWRCMSVDYDIRDDNTSPKVWTWRFEFQYAAEVRTSTGDVSGWVSTVVATDDRGRPVANPNPAKDQIKDVVHYRFKNFNEKFKK